MSVPHDPPPPRKSFRVGRTTDVGENVLAVRNRVQWGPIIAGVLAAIVVFLLLTILGFALGASVLDPANTAGEIGTWAAIWGGEPLTKKVSARSRTAGARGNAYT